MSHSARIMRERSVRGISSQMPAQLYRPNHEAHDQKLLENHSACEDMETEICWFDSFVERQ